LAISTVKVAAITLLLGIAHTLHVVAVKQICEAQAVMASSIVSLRPKMQGI
jgi:hypothetical protein